MTEKQEPKTSQKNFVVAVEHQIPTHKISDVINAGLQWRLDWRQGVFNKDFEGNQLDNLFIGELETGDWLEQLQEKKLEFKDNPENGLHELTSERIAQGLQTMARDYPLQMRNIINDDFDANTGDILIQCSLFGQEIYA